MTEYYEKFGQKEVRNVLKDSQEMVFFLVLLLIRGLPIDRWMASTIQELQQL